MPAGLCPPKANAKLCLPAGDASDASRLFLLNSLDPLINGDVMIAFPSATTMVLTGLAGIIGGFVRGYSGFGFGLAAMPILTIGLLPAIAVPTSLIMEVVISCAALPKVRANIQSSILGWLSLGTLIGTPIGLAVLVAVPVDIMRLTIAMLVAISVIILWRQPVLSRRAPGSPSLTVAGFVSGVLNGGAGMAAPPIVIVLLGSDAQPRVVRATVMAFVTISAVLGIGLAIAKGLYTIEAIVPLLILVPCSVIGVLVGGAVFANTNHAHYRTISLAILFAVSCTAMITVSRNFFHFPS
jgi:uncharacterized membrane protein YfcA